MKRRILSSASLFLIIVLVLTLQGFAEGIYVEESIQSEPFELEEFDLMAPETGDDCGITPDESAIASQGDEEPTFSDAAEEDAVPKASVAVPKKLTLGVKEKYALKVSGAKKYASSNTKVATVSKKGVIVAKKVGKATITVTNKKGKKIKVKVIVRKAPIKVTVKPNKAALVVGETLKLKAALPTETASNKLTWSSAKKRVATVNADGVVTAVAPGVVKITVKTYNKKKATCTVTVTAPTVPPETVGTIASLTVKCGDVVADKEVILLPDETVRAMWSAEGDVASYYYQIIGPDGAVIAHEEAGNTASYKIANDALAPGEVYTLKVGAMPVNGAENDIVWKSVSFKRANKSGFIMDNGVVIGYTGKGGNIDIPSVDNEGKSIVAIGDGAFKGNIEITGVSIPATVTKIGDAAFKGCTALKKVVIPNGITTIGKAAFMNCESLSDMTTFD